jgi:2-dehydropantoate 2-reductase
MKLNSQSKPWHILGAGALGCLWAFHGVGDKRDIRLILRHRESLTQFQRSGGVSAIIDGKARLHPCKAVLANQLDTPIEQLLICCKAHQTRAAFTSVAAALTQQSTVVLLQNGMGVAQELLSQRPGLRLFCAVSTDGAHRVDKFTVQRAGHGITRLGRFPRDPDLHASQKLCQQLAIPGLTLEPCEDILFAQWQKLAVNAVINPLTAIFSLSNGELPSHLEASTLITPLCQEIASIGQAEGIELNAANIEHSIVQVCQQTAANISSMLQDIRQRRPNEVDYINGFLQRCAAAHGLQVPVNHQLIERLAELETYPRG